MSDEQEDVKPDETEQDTSDTTEQEESSNETPAPVGQEDNNGWEEVTTAAVVNVPSENVHVELPNATPTAAVKQDKPYNYLDTINAKKAEIRRAKIEGREPDFSNMPGIESIDPEHL